MSRLRWFGRQSWKVQVLAGVAFMLTAPVRLAILVVPFRYLSRILGKENTESPEDVSSAVLRKAKLVGGVVEVVSLYTPWESKCLVKAITAQLILRVFRIPSTLYLGVAKHATNQQLLAHAWLRCGPFVMTGALEREGYQCVARFSSLSRHAA